ncbi:MAG: HDIG domain-containing protein [Planctomycetes bacterium]|nr:HDIG domain-containing protein [Planctomycetota bacterium]
MSAPLEAPYLAAVAEALDRLCTLAKAVQIYGGEHRRARAALSDYLDKTRRVADFGADAHKEFLIAYHDGRFYLENVPLPLQTQQCALLRQQLADGNYGGFQLSLQLEAADLLAVLKKIVATGTSNDITRAEVPGFRWLSCNDVHQRAVAGRVYRRPINVLLGIPELNIDGRIYDATLLALTSFMEQCAEGPERIGDTATMMQIGNRLVGQFIESSDRILPLATVPYYDNFTYHHSLNVTLLTLSAARLVITDRTQLERIGQAALLHDIGKADAPNEILYKPGRLTDAEAKIVMNHPVSGARRLVQFPQIDPLSVSVAFGHHIKDNGHGYPKVSPGYRLGPVTRLLQVADIFEALTAHRPYKQALTAAQAFDVIYSMPNMGSFRGYIDLLLRAIGFNPVGSRVRTVDGQIAIVVGHSDGDPRRPIVRPVHADGQGLRVDAARVATSTTAETASGETPQIAPDGVVALDPEEDVSVACVAESTA